MCINFVPETKIFFIFIFWCGIFYLAHCMDIRSSELSLMEFRLGMLSLSKHPDKTASKTVVILPQAGHWGLECRHLIPAKTRECFVCQSSSFWVLGVWWETVHLDWYLWAFTSPFSHHSTILNWLWSSVVLAHAHWAQQREWRWNWVACSRKLWTEPSLLWSITERRGGGFSALGC